MLYTLWMLVAHIVFPFVAGAAMPWLVVHLWRLVISPFIWRNYVEPHPTPFAQLLAACEKLVQADEEYHDDYAQQYPEQVLERVDDVRVLLGKLKESK